jgi:hypothetical protein
MQIKTMCNSVENSIVTMESEKYSSGGGGGGGAIIFRHSVLPTYFEVDPGILRDSTGNRRGRRGTPNYFCF